jgi:pilus assembly protein CpaB
MKIREGMNVAKLSSKGLLVIALVLSLITSLLVYNYLKGVTAKMNKQSLPVVVAKINIPPKTKITAEMVHEVLVPTDYIQPGAVQGLSSALGITTRENIVAGEQVTQQRLVIDGKSVGFSGIIPRDKRAVSVAVTEVTGVAGFVKPGDYVDVLVTFDKQDIGEHASQMVLQNLQVLAADREAISGPKEASKDKKDALSATTVTLAVSPDEAARLTIAEEKGKIRLALRPYQPSDGAVTNTTVTPKDLVGSFAPAAQPSITDGSSAPPAPPQPSGIQMIRGTKVETVPVH